MLEVTSKQVYEILVHLGLRPGDGVLVHSALHFLGRPAEGPLTYTRALAQAINLPIPSLGFQADMTEGIGTLAVPTFNFGFARGKVFNPQQTPAEGMGIFSEHIRQLPEAHRTSHPMQSMALIGAQAKALAQLDTPSAFEAGSAFAKLLDLNFYVLLFGAEIQAVSLLHYSEQRAQVPYRYWKDFSGQIQLGEKTIPKSYRMFARNMEINAQLEIYAVKAILQKRSQWRSVHLNYGEVAVFSARNFIAAVDHLLAQDPWIFVTNPPTE